MQYGVVYPQTEFSSDPAAIRDYVDAVVGSGYSHVLAYDHVLGANPVRPGGWQGPYTHQSAFMEPFVLFSYMAGLSQKLEFATGVIILPQRQTALVAKQAASLDVLCGGKLRLGVGIGWNEIEYAAQGENFHNRGKRIEEQIFLMRALWTNSLVTFTGKWHRIDDAGVNPLPIQRPIPIWMGGQAEPVLKRAGRIADGWMPNFRTADAAKPSLDILRKALESAGRGDRPFGIEARLSIVSGNEPTWESIVRGWEAVGATHISINTMGAGFTTPEEHIRAVELFAVNMGLGG